jgi:hypothetical protein
MLKLLENVLKGSLQDDIMYGKFMHVLRGDDEGL